MERGVVPNQPRRPPQRDVTRFPPPPPEPNGRQLESGARSWTSGAPGTTVTRRHDGYTAAASTTADRRSISPRLARRGGCSSGQGDKEEVGGGGGRVPAVFFSD